MLPRIELTGQRFGRWVVLYLAEKQGRRVVPELIQGEFTPQRVAEETVALLTDPARYARTREALQRVREQLGAPGASGPAAMSVTIDLD